jgi:hypothetical protein
MDLEFVMNRFEFASPQHSKLFRDFMAGQRMVLPAGDVRMV